MDSVGWRGAGRRLIVVLAGVVAALLIVLSAPALAQAESLEITTSAEPTQDVPVSIKVAGVADGHHKLYVFVNTYGGACSATPQYDGGTPLANGTTLSAGAFEETYTYTPQSVQSYMLCAYLDESVYATPDQAATDSFSAAMPAASAAIEVSGKLTQNIPMKIRVSGTTEVARNLYVFVNTYGGACSSTPQYDGGSPLANGTSIAAGSWSGEYSYTPTSIQSYTVCAYVDESVYATPDASATATFTAGRPAAAISVAVSPTATENGAVSVKLSGSVEVPRSLYVFVNTYGGACSSTPQYDGGSPLANGTSLSAGPFSAEYSYTPTSTGTYTVCGYVAENVYATPDAAASATFTNTTPADRAQAAAEAAAEKQREEAEAAAQAKRAAACKKAFEKVWAEGREYTSEYTTGDETRCSGEEAKEYKAAMRAKEKAEGEAYEREYVAAKAAARKKPLNRLAVRVVGHNGRSSAHPGYSAVIISAASFATVTLKLTRYGHQTERYEFGENAREEIRRTWTCVKPGGVYHYTVTARSGVGRTLTRRGEFRPVSFARCHSLKRAEAEAVERERAHVEAERARERNEETERQRRFEANCRKENGTPREFDTESGNQIRCVAPGGGFLTVPY